jgi:hypothetical protein
MTGLIHISSICKHELYNIDREIMISSKFEKIFIYGSYSSIASIIGLAWSQYE